MNGPDTSTIDINEVLTRTLEASEALLGIDAAMIVLDSTNGSPVVASVGLPGVAEGPPDHVAFSDGVHAEFGRPRRL